MVKQEPSKFDSKVGSEQIRSTKIASPYSTVKNLQDARIVLPNLVYIIGLSPKLTSPSTLKLPEYLGQYGKIAKIVVNTSKVYNSTYNEGPTYSAHITFENQADAALAVLCLDNTTVHNRLIKASFGTSKLRFNKILQHLH